MAQLLGTRGLNASVAHIAERHSRSPTSDCTSATRPMGWSRSIKFRDASIELKFLGLLRISESFVLESIGSGAPKACQELSARLAGNADVSVRQKRDNLPLSCWVPTEYQLVVDD